MVRTEYIPETRDDLNGVLVRNFDGTELINEVWYSNPESARKCNDRILARRERIFRPGMWNGEFTL